MRPSKIRVAKYEHSATSKWVVEGLKNNKGRRSRKFFHTKAEADLFARDAHAEQTQLGCSSVTLPFELRLSAISCAEKLKPFGKTHGPPQPLLRTAAKHKSSPLLPAKFAATIWTLVR